MWAGAGAPGFTPRFETTRNWARSAGGFAPGADDIAFDMARDLLTAQSLLARAGFAAHAHCAGGPAGRDRACSSRRWPRPSSRTSAAPGPSACARRLAGRARLRMVRHRKRAERHRAGLGRQLRLCHRRAAARRRAATQVDQLIVLEGLQSDPLDAASSRRCSASACCALPLATLDAAPACIADAACGGRPRGRGRARRRLRAAPPGRRPRAGGAGGHRPRADAPHQRAAGRARRGAARRDRLEALDHARGRHADERAARLRPRCRQRRRCSTGSRTPPPSTAARSGGSKRACASAACATGAAGAASWPRAATAAGCGAAGLHRRRRSAARDAGPRPAAGRLARRHARAAQAGGQWAAAGTATPRASKCIAALYLRCTATSETARRRAAPWPSSPPGCATCSRPPACACPSDADEPQVVVLPLHQLLGPRLRRAWSCRAATTSACPLRPSRPATGRAAQRAALGAAFARERWRPRSARPGPSRLRAPRVDLLWRRFDASGEPVRPSALVQMLHLRARGAPRRGRSAHPGAAWPRGRRRIRSRAAQALPLAKLSSTAYEDLRRCPYRFFALRQLGLRSSDELDAEVDKRDFGNWLHAVLGTFHEALKAAPTAGPVGAARADGDRGRARRRASSACREAEFLPFAAAWPAVRDGYLAWLAEHEAGEGAVFVEAEPCEGGAAGQREAGRPARPHRSPRPMAAPS